jgi:two-component system sensor histidine kinase YesM
MKLRNKMVLYYSTVMLLLSIVFSTLFYSLSSKYEKENQKRSLYVNSNQVVLQLEDRMQRMDTILNYILSDAKTIDSIIALRHNQTKELPANYISNARNTIRVRLNTDYIYHNSYRAVYANTPNIVISSTGSTHRLKNINTWNVDDFYWIKEAKACPGKTISSSIHRDYWGSVGGPYVFSRIKYLQGDKLGCIEVSETVESLANLSLSDDDIRYAIVHENGELLFRSDASIHDDLIESLLNNSSTAKVVKMEDIYAVVNTSNLYNFQVVLVKSTQAMHAIQRTLLLSSISFGLIIFLVAFAFIVFWAYFLTKPINNIKDIIDATSIENLQDLPIEDDSIREIDELQELANSFHNMRLRLKSAIIEEQKSNSLQLQAQFDALQAQINPHFLYNVLNIISSKGIINGDESISEMCAALGSILRYSTNTKERYASIGIELEYLNKFIYLLQQRYGDNLSIEVHVDKEMMDFSIPKMTLQQILENSLRHGFQHADRAMKIRIEGFLEKEKWYLKISDNGQGFSEESLQLIDEKIELVKEHINQKKEFPEVEIGGMGLVNTFARCYLLYRDCLIFEVSNGEDGAVVMIGVNDRR